ncbi:hypothetical protein Vadar_004946 [Vaccinium darrowii]|uniref:Uncharacterized protein n=1 Tax=Vaccinium darrowii TaxID=229202 RepID=A0ACB7XXG4_9ERIC|nr:hypothetical protein Vadar_004946 [Vaccinium darrowii]
MEQIETTSVSAFADLPQQSKVLARQLNFTANVILPEHPQAVLQSRLLALAHLQQSQPPRSVSHLQPQQPRPKKLLPVRPQPWLASPPLKSESPKSRQRCSIVGKDGTPKKQKKCNCKNSRCLKLYCDCFALGIYCDGCNCTNCYNNIEHDDVRQKAVGATLERNPNAFRPKIADSPHRLQDGREEAREVSVVAIHNKGCNCKKTGCLKKYCECFQANVLCSANCKCMDCKNYEGSEERSDLFHGGHANSTSYIQQAENIGINGAIGTSWLSTPPSSKKWKNQQPIFGSTASDQSIHGTQFKQLNHSRTSACSSSLFCTSATSMGSIKLTCRSQLADVLRSQDVNELCSLLVIVSEEATRAVAGRKSKMDKQGQSNQLEDSIFSSAQHGKVQGNGQMDTVDEPLSGNHAAIANNSESDRRDEQTRRPPSPATLALMCDEQDSISMATGDLSVLFPLQPAAAACIGNRTLKSCQDVTDLYAEQERIVLKKFRNFLSSLIDCGSIKGVMCSPLLKPEPGIQQEPLDYSITTQFETSLKEPNGCGM